MISRSISQDPIQTDLASKQINEIFLYPYSGDINILDKIARNEAIKSPVIREGLYYLNEARMLATAFLISWLLNSGAMKMVNEKEYSEDYFYDSSSVLKFCDGSKIFVVGNKDLIRGICINLFGAACRSLPQGNALSDKEQSDYVFKIITKQIISMKAYIESEYQSKISDILENEIEQPTQETIDLFFPVLS